MHVAHHAHFVNARCTQDRVLIFATEQVTSFSGRRGRGLTTCPFTSSFALQHYMNSGFVQLMNHQLELKLEKQHESVAVIVTARTKC